jgi:hypothetical protein
MDRDLLKALDQLHDDPTYIKFEDKLINDKFNEIKSEIIAEFNNHPITREIDGGIDAPNYSGTLNGITNLYSFIGFNSGDDPIAPIRMILNKSNYRIIRQKKGSVSTVVFEIPTSAQIFAETPMPWAVGRSWAKGIETGISGLGYYLKKSRNSRSGLGVQSQTQIRQGVVFRNTKYISDLINRYNVKIKNLEKLVI